MGTRVALVTGGSNGIGRAVVNRLASLGHQVAFSWCNDEVGAKMAEAELGDQVHAYHCDLEDTKSVDAMVGAVEDDLGTIEILVNNAGITAIEVIPRITDEAWDHTLAVDLRGPFVVTRRALRKMRRKRWGRIVNVSSIGAFTGPGGQAHYAAAKAGLVGFSRSLAREVAHVGITSNVVCPGFTDTRMVEHELPIAKPETFADQVPVNRLGTVDEIAYVITSLVHEDASYITGAVIPVDGGLGMGL